MGRNFLSNPIMHHFHDSKIISKMDSNSGFLGIHIPNPRTSIMQGQSIEGRHRCKVVTTGPELEVWNNLKSPGCSHQLVNTRIIYRFSREFLQIFWQIKHEWLKCEHDIWPFLKKRLSSVHWLYNWRFGWPAISYISCFLMIPSYIYERKTHSDFYGDSKDPLMGKFIHRSWPGVDEMQLLDGR